MTTEARLAARLDDTARTAALEGAMPSDAAKQGYLALATGPRKYVEMALNLAASIKVVDPSRRVCLVHDRHADISYDARTLFDDFVMLDDAPSYHPILNKLRLFDSSPYEQSMFVDADCLLVRHDVSDYWRRCVGQPFAITGDVQTTGRWKGHDVPQLLATYEAPYIVRLNSGLFYFDRSPTAASFFAALKNLHGRHSEDLVALDNPRKYEDELFFGVVMGQMGLLPTLHSDEQGNTIMATTWHAPICLADPKRGRSALYKPTGHFFGQPILPRGYRRLSPTFMHFVGLKPRRLYDRLSTRFRNAALDRHPSSGSLRSEAPT